LVNPTDLDYVGPDPNTLATTCAPRPVKSEPFSANAEPDSHDKITNCSS